MISMVFEENHAKAGDPSGSTDAIAIHWDRWVHVPCLGNQSSKSAKGDGALCSMDVNRARSNMVTLLTTVSLTYLNVCKPEAGSSNFCKRWPKPAAGCSLDDFGGGQREAIATMRCDNLNPDGQPGLIPTGTWLTGCSVMLRPR